MKRLYFFYTCLMAASLCSCEQVAVKDIDKAQQLIDVNLNLSGFETSQTRATITEANISNLAFKAIDANGESQATIAQTSDDEDFGSISLKLPVGDYTFVAVANTKNAPATITSDTEASISSAQNVTAYSSIKSVTIAGNTSQSVTMDMGKRRNTSFILKMTDPTPDDVTKLQIQVSPTAPAATSLTFNPSTGLTNEIKLYEISQLKSATDGSFKNKFLSLHFLLTKASETLDVKIDALSSSGEVIYTRTLKDVPFKQSQSTTATGTFFSSSTSESFTFDTSVVNNDISLD